MEPCSWAAEPDGAGGRLTVLMTVGEKEVAGRDASGLGGGASDGEEVLGPAAGHGPCGAEGQAEGLAPGQGHAGAHGAGLGDSVRHDGATVVACGGKVHRKHSYVVRQPEGVYDLHRPMLPINTRVWLGDTMLVIGNQLRAARALIGLEQAQLADASGLHVNTIRKMEARGSAEITSLADNVRRIQAALEQQGVEFLNHGRPGVRLRDRAARSAEGLRPDQIA